MPAHPQLTEAQATRMVAYVLSLAQEEAASLPLHGDYMPPDSAARSNDGAVLLHATYTDRGANGILGAASETTVVLRAPTVVVAKGTLSEGAQKMSVQGMPFDITLASRSGAHVKLAGIDLTHLAAVNLLLNAPAPYGMVGGKVEVHVDSATGMLLGETEMLRPSPDSASPPTTLRAVLAPVSGAHDLYLVFRNEQAANGQMLFALLTATFEPAPESPRAPGESHAPGRPTALGDAGARRGRSVHSTLRGHRS